jgi:pentatricopeptide repeat protein
MRATVACRYVSLMDTVLVGRWAPPTSAAGATEMFRQWKTRTRNRPVVPQHGALMAKACLQEGDVPSAMSIVFSQENTVPLLQSLSGIVRAAGGPPLDVSEKVVVAMKPVADALQGRPGQAEFISVLLFYASNVLQGTTSTVGEGELAASARTSAELVVESAIRVAQSSPSHAAILLEPIAQAASPLQLDRVVALVDVAFRGRREYIAADGLRAVLKAIAHRREFDQQIMTWWRWMQHTQLSLEPAVLSLVIEVLCRAHKPTEAAEVVQQLQALNCVPEPQAQLLYLQHLVTISRPPVAQAELLVHLWTHAHPSTTDGHAAALQWALLQFYYTTNNSNMIRIVSAALLRDHSATMAEEHLSALLQRIVDDTAAVRPKGEAGDLLERHAVRVLLERFAPQRAETICTAAVLASRAGCVELVGPWLEACSDEIFEEGLNLVASRSSKLALELCEVSHRVVPDTLDAWSKLLGDDTSTLE